MGKFSQIISYNLTKQLGNLPFCVYRAHWATLKDKPETFTVDALGGATITLGFIGVKYAL